MKESWTIGSHPDCDIVVDEPTVSGRHCRLSLYNGIWSIADLDSTNGTWVDGVRIEGPRPVKRGDELRLGQSVLLDWSRVPNFEPCIRVGRADNNQIVLKDSSVSAHHATIKCTSDGLVLEDLSTTNGTFVGTKNWNERIDSRKVSLADRVRFGNVEMNVNDLICDAAKRVPELKNWLEKNPQPAPPAWVPGKRIAIVAGLGVFLLIGYLFVIMFAGRKDDPSLRGAQHQQTVNQSSTSPNSTEAEDTDAADAKRKPIEPAEQTGQEPETGVVAKEVAEQIDRRVTGSPDGLYSVIVRSESDGLAFQVGTAWALTDEWLVTSAEVIHAMEQASNDAVWEVYWGKGDRLSIVKSAVHPSYQAAEEVADRALDQYKSLLEREAAAETAGGKQEYTDKVLKLNQQFRKAASKLVFFDIGLLGVKLPPNTTLKKHLQIAPKPINRIKGRDLIVSGHSYPTMEKIEFDPDNISVAKLSAEILTSTRDSEDSSLSTRSNVYLVHAECPENSKENLRACNWMGSPVLDNQGRVIGIFSRVAVPDESTVSNQSENVSPQELRVFLMPVVDRLDEFPTLQGSSIGQ